LTSGARIPEQKEFFSLIIHCFEVPT